MAEWPIRNLNCQVVTTVDIRKAFTSIPKDRLIATVRKSLPPGIPEQLVMLMEKIIRRPLPAGDGIRQRCGIAQGSPLSPMLLNIYLNHHLDQKWDHQRWPMVRYADDILLLTTNTSEADAALTTLRTLLQPNGLNLRDERSDVVDLAGGEPANWLGYHIQVTGHRTRIGISEQAWQKLEHGLRRAQLDDDYYHCGTVQALRGWLQYAGPAFWAGKTASDQRRTLISRVSSLLASVGVDERRLSSRVVHRMWRTAHVGWIRRRRRSQTRLAQALALAS